MKAEIIAVGAELLMGETQDTNSSWIGSRLPELGLQLQWVTIVGDDVGMLVDIIGRAWERSDVVLTIGGLGPTKDDVTRDGIAGVLGEEMTVDPGLAEWLESSFAPPQHSAHASAEPPASEHHSVGQGDSQQPRDSA